MYHRRADLRHPIPRRPDRRRPARRLAFEPLEDRRMLSVRIGPPEWQAVESAALSTDVEIGAGSPGADGDASRTDVRVTHKMEEGTEVHQWVALQAYHLLASQFDFGGVGGGFGELGSYLVAPTLTPLSTWTQIASASHSYNGNNNIIEGSRDEDTTDNPFGQTFPYFRHFVHGGDGDGLFQGLDDWWIPGSDPGQDGSYYSAYEQAFRYWYGWNDGAGPQPGTIDLYLANSKTTAYWYLGHVVHLLTDMAVPAHVHGDAHGGPLLGGYDSYEDWTAADNHFLAYGAWSTAPGWQVYVPTDLESFFRLTVRYTADYDSNDYDGWDAPGKTGPAFSADYRATGRHRPTEVNRSDGISAAECQIIAADLLPWAIEQTAALYRFFFSWTDTTAPLVALPNLSQNVNAPTLVRTTATTISGTASDAQSGVGKNLYEFYTARWTGSGWTSWVSHGRGGPELQLAGLDEGLYAVSVKAQNGAGLETFAPTSYFRVELPQVVGRHVFYNNSWFDGNNAGANAADDAAIATDKQAILPGGAATFLNYTSYDKGINGVMIDVRGLPLAGLGTGDFQFHAGNTGDPAGWTAAPPPQTIEVRRGAGVGGSDRVTLIWADGAIVNQWLEITVRATANTGLAAPDVFCFGNVPGETGDVPGSAAVNVQDVALTRANQTGFTVAAITNRYDFNRDGRVNAQDVTLARGNLSGASPLPLVAPLAPLFAAEFLPAQPGAVSASAASPAIEAGSESAVGPSDALPEPLRMCWTQRLRGRAGSTATPRPALMTALDARRRLLAVEPAGPCLPARNERGEPVAESIDAVLAAWESLD